MPKSVAVVPPPTSSSGVIRMWWLSLGLATVVVGAVAGLLGLIIVTARKIDDHAEAIWTVGKQIAGNTVSIWMLEKTNDQAGKILEAVQSLGQSVASIDEQLRALAGQDGQKG